MESSVEPQANCWLSFDVTLESIQWERALDLRVFSHFFVHFYTSKRVWWDLTCHIALVALNSLRWRAMRTFQASTIDFLIMHNDYRKKETHIYTCTYNLQDKASEDTIDFLTVIHSFQNENKTFFFLIFERVCKKKKI